MNNLSKLNIVLIVTTAIAVIIAIYALLKINKTEPASIQVESEMIAKSETVNEPKIVNNSESVSESVEINEEDPFSNGFDSIEATGYVQNLLQEYFYNKAMNSSDKKVREPFGRKIINVPNTIIDYRKQVYNPQTRTEEFFEVQKNISYFDFDTISSVINNFQLVNCDKTLTRNSKLAYDCILLLPDIYESGLNETENKGPWNFRILIVKQDSGYEVTSFE
ncbi:hypothetical protein [Acinetobacter sp. ANC 4973]|uniref:hypothetical protein n=1 Tax=Acinetobacter sp. ANC 4973 TaxID=1977871 RepID=UPI000A34DE6F|nr:hypothetical protein [Acinetobacter sp. ANC 4973]OTG93230.1 hypothetical protein B9T30_16140 [Acinetobacter sp. ANC 4973]